MNQVIRFAARQKDGEGQRRHFKLNRVGILDDGGNIDTQRCLVRKIDLLKIHPVDFEFR
jgi:hypothetical protein